MPTVLTAADIAITRSGAITISELIRSKTPSILIPSPNVTANHQYYNAKYMESLGCSILIEEKDLNVESLEDAVFGIISYPEKISAMTESLKKASTKDTELLIQKSLSVLIKR